MSAPSAALAGERRLGRLLRAPATLLTAVVIGSALIRAAVGLGTPSPWVLPDGLVYSDLARALAAGDRPSVRDVPVVGWGEIYPMLIAPVWALVEDRYVAYQITLLVNSLLMSLAAVPAYLLARLFVSRTSSLAVAVLAVAVPSLSYTGAVLTENAYYPLFLLALLALARAVRRPTLAAQTFALVSLALLAFTRIQGVSLLAGYGCAVLLYAMTAEEGRRGAYLRRFAASALVAVLVVSAPPIWSVARGEGVVGWLGQRSGTFAEFQPLEVPQWFVFLGVGLILYVAVIPAVATAVVSVLGLSSQAPERLRLFAAVALPSVAVTLLGIAFVSATFDVDGVGNLNERYVFSLVPLSFIGLALWIEHGLPRPRPWAWLALGTACVAPVLLPIDRLDYNAGLQALALLPWAELAGSGLGIAALVGVCTTAFGAAWLAVGPRTAPRLWWLVGLWMVVLGLFAVESQQVSASRTAASLEGHSATWVDDAVPPGSDVVVVWDETRARKGLPDSFYFWLMVTEFFNRSVSEVYGIGPQTFYEDFLPTLRSDAGPRRVLRDRSGRLVSAEYALVTCRTPIEGRPVAQSARGALVLVHVGGPVVLRGDDAGCRRAQP